MRPSRLRVRLISISYAVAITLAAQQRSDTLTAADGGSRELMISIFVPPTPQAPFSLVLHTEWQRALANGGTYTLVNTRRIMRDSIGRIYQERVFLVPKSGKIPDSKISNIQIGDPAAHTFYNCVVSTKKCDLLRYARSSSTEYLPQSVTTGPFPDGNGYYLHEELGTGNVAGIPTVGRRDTTTFNAGFAGNDRPMVTAQEAWYSPQLGISLLSIVESPSSGKQTFSATDVSTVEPEHKFFEPPAGYAVIDRRATESPTD